MVRILDSSFVNEPARSSTVPSPSPTTTQQDEAVSENFYHSVAVTAVTIAASAVFLVSAYFIYRRLRKRNTERYFRAIEKNGDDGMNTSCSQELTSPMIDDAEFWTNIGKQRRYDDGSSDSEGRREDDYDPFSVTAEGFWLVHGSDEEEGEAGGKGGFCEGGGDFGGIVGGEEAMANILHGGNPELCEFKLQRRRSKPELNDGNIGDNDKGEMLV